MATTGWNPTAMPGAETRFSPLIPDVTRTAGEGSVAGERQSDGDGEH